LSAAAIEATKLGLTIGGKSILNDVTFAVNKGDYLVIIGPNGAGKTTLLKCLMRIINGWRGSISVSGISLKKYTQKELAKLISYVPQANGRALYFTASEFVAMGRYPHMSPFSSISKDDRRIIDEALDLTGILSLAGQRLASLSGGERQCVFIAAAIAQGAEVLLLDEPTTFLDPSHQSQILSLLEHLNNTLGLTIVAVTHDINCAALWSDRVLALKEGEIVFSGTNDDLMCNKVLETIYERQFAFSSHPQNGSRFIIPEGRSR